MFHKGPSNQHSQLISLRDEPTHFRFPGAIAPGWPRVTVLGERRSSALTNRNLLRWGASHYSHIEAAIWQAAPTWRRLGRKPRNRFANTTPPARGARHSSPEWRALFPRQVKYSVSTGIGRALRRPRGGGVQWRTSCLRGQHASVDETSGLGAEAVPAGRACGLVAASVAWAADPAGTAPVPRVQIRHCRIPASARMRESGPPRWCPTPRSCRYR